MAWPDTTTNPAPARAWSVAALLLAVADALAARLGAVTVRGEISGFTRAASGHCYFSLKDSDGQQALLRCAMFRRAAGLLDFRPADGQQVELRGRITVYESRGELQCVVEHLQRLGDGSLYELFLKLKARLAAAGLFDAQRKRPLPAHPRTVGVVTSLGAAALHDVLTAIVRRAPQVQVVVYPCLCRGPRHRRRSCGPSTRPMPGRRWMCCWSAAVVARWKTCGPSTTRRWCGQWPAARCRWCAAWATRPTCAGRALRPTCGRPRPPPRPSWRCRRRDELLADLDDTARHGTHPAPAALRHRRAGPALQRRKRWSFTTASTTTPTWST
jgi:hypothetical protein